MGWWGRGEGQWTPIRCLLRDSYQWATSWNICHPVIHHRTSTEAVRGNDGLSREVLGRGRTPDCTFWGFHHCILSLHDQSDSGTGRCASTSTVFSACNKSMISSDDKSARWWISVQVRWIYCTTRFIWSMCRMEVAPGESECLNKTEMHRSSRQKSHLKYETLIWRNAVLSFRRRSASRCM